MFDWYETTFDVDKDGNLVPISPLITLGDRLREIEKSYYLKPKTYILGDYFKPKIIKD